MTVPAPSSSMIATGSPQRDIRGGSLCHWTELHAAGTRRHIAGRGGTRTVFVWPRMERVPLTDPSFIALSAGQSRLRHELHQLALETTVKVL
jgi:hypothetical protein